MFWVAVVAGVILGIVGAVVAIGAMLPVNHVASGTARYDVAAERLYAIVADFASAPTWRSDVQRVETLPPRVDHIVYREHAGHGSITYEILEQEPPRRIVRRIVDNRSFGGTWTLEVAPDGTGSTLTITERGEVYNPLFRFVSRYIMGHDATIRRFENDLRASLAHGRST